jgi:L-alanine-DL-glutamate epimerase-like enolase superfamily enzyme
MEIATRILQRVGSLDKAIRTADTLMHTAHTAWDYKKYKRVGQALEEIKLQKDLDCNE